MKYITIYVRVRVHAYADEELCDEVLLDVNQRSAINPPEVMNAVFGVKDQVFEVIIDKSTSVKEFEASLHSLIWGEKWKKTAKDFFEFYYLFNGCRAVIIKPKVNILKYIRKYIDPVKTNHIEVAYYFCLDAGQIMEVENLRFYMHSKEKGRHNKPHVHVEDINKGVECSICILNGELLDGKIKKKDFRKAQKIINDNKDLFIDYWNKYTDGLDVDINYSLGLAKC